MTTWARACAERPSCGGCGKPFALGDPVALITSPQTGVTWVLRRCVECAGPAPADLPPLEYEQQRPRHAPPSSLTKLSVVAGRFVLPVEREPGEEG